MSLDNSPGTTDLSAAVQGLSDSDKREIQTFIQNEQQRAGIQECMHLILPRATCLFFFLCLRLPAACGKMLISYVQLYTT